MVYINMYYILVNISTNILMRIKLISHISMCGASEAFSKAQIEHVRLNANSQETFRIDGVCFIYECTVSYLVLSSINESDVILTRKPKENKIDCCARHVME